MAAHRQRRITGCDVWGCDVRFQSSDRWLRRVFMQLVTASHIRSVLRKCSNSHMLLPSGSLCKQRGKSEGSVERAAASQTGALLLPLWSHDRTLWLGTSREVSCTRKETSDPEEETLPPLYSQSSL